MNTIEFSLPSHHGPATKLRPAALGLVAASVMLGVYFGALTLTSGWDYTVSQFVSFWYFVLPLAIGFGLQVGFYVYLRQLTSGDRCGTVVATSGTTSTVAMISCCAHYLTNILPVVGAVGLVTVIAEYQVELFWLGLAFNAGGLAFIIYRVITAKHHMREMLA